MGLCDAGEYRAEYVFLTVGIMGRSDIIKNNYENKSTGELSFITAFLSFGGTLSRVFTSVVETDNLQLLVRRCYCLDFMHRELYSGHDYHDPVRAVLERRDIRTEGKRHALC